MTLPKFSIVIPTVDRHELLEKTIAGCLLSPYPNLEVLVSDNFSSPETAKVVENFLADPRVHYVRTERRLSMPDHWEFAWRKSTGDYIIINGDDDAVSPSLIEQLAVIAETFDAGLMSWDAGLYYHPDWNLSDVNTFTFMAGHSRMLLDIDPQAVFASYARLNIPLCFPQGTRICFSRKLADRAVAKTGRVFWSPYPDYSAPLLLLGLLQNERYIYWDALMGYGGRSRDSNAAAWSKEGSKTGNTQRAKDYFTELEEAKEDVYPYSSLKIKSYSNGHAETVNLLRHILPEVFARHRVDQMALIASVECEFLGINIHNPFLEPRERKEFDAFLEKQDSEIVAVAMREVENRALRERKLRWYGKPTTPVEDVVGVILKILCRSQLVGPYLFNLAQGRGWGYVWHRVTEIFKHFLARNSGEPHNQPAPVRLEFSGSMRKLQCADLGCHDGLELARQIDNIADRFDNRSWNIIVQFAEAGFLRAAYKSTAAARPQQVRPLCP